MRYLIPHCPGYFNSKVNLQSYAYCHIAENFRDFDFPMFELPLKINFLSLTPRAYHRRYRVPR